jgi:hypothetical protein
VLQILLNEKLILIFIQTNLYITFLSNVGRVLLPSQESRVVNRENTHSLVTSPLTQIEVKSFLGIIGRYFLVFANVTFYWTKSIQECYLVIQTPQNGASGLLGLNNLDCDLISDLDIQSISSHVKPSKVTLQAGLHYFNLEATWANSAWSGKLKNQLQAVLLYSMLERPPPEFSSRIPSHRTSRSDHNYHGTTTQYTIHFNESWPHQGKHKATATIPVKCTKKLHSIRAM